MWWSPTNERESALANDVQLLRNWFVEREVFRGHHPIAFGVGSIWSPQERALSPFVLLNRRAFRYLPVPPAPVFPFSEIFHYAGGGDYLSLLSFPETQLRTYAMAVTRPRPTNAMISLSPQILKERLLAEFVQVREPISCMHSGNQGSAGVAVWDEANEEPALLTAGHIFPDGVGSRVDKVHWRLKRFPRFFPKVVHLGTITHHVAPNGPIAAWDAAVIRLAEIGEPAVIRLAKIKKPSVSLVWRKYERFKSPEKIWVHGAFSKLVLKAVVQGALTDLGSDQMMWKDCWIVAPSGLLTDGDSGAAVFVERDSSLLGMYVAKSEFLGSRVPLVHYVQDAFRMEQEVLSNWNIRFRMGG